MAGNKWLLEVDAGTATDAAARAALAPRLEALQHALGAALQSIDDAYEHVHQLRVACRRAEAAVRLFGICLPRPVAKGARRTLRKLRRAAGAARDCDVHLLELGSRLHKADHKTVPGLDLLFGYCLAERIPAQEQLEHICPGYPFEYERWMASVLGAIHPPAGDLPRLADVGRAALLPDFDIFWRHLQRPCPTWEELHETRIVAKRLRYAVELLAGAFPADLRNLIYPQLSDVQSMLGQANDGFVGVRRMEVLARRLPELCPTAWPRWSPVVHEMLDEYRCSMRRASERFEVWKRGVLRDRLDLTMRRILGGSPGTNVFAIIHAS